MKKKFLVSSLLGFITISGVIYKSLTKKIEQTPIEKNDDVLKEIENIHDIWVNGKISDFDLRKCSRLFHSGIKEKDIYLKCNPDVLLCLYQNISSKSGVSVDFRFDSQSSYKIIHRLDDEFHSVPRYGLWLRIKDQNFSQEIILEDSCRDAYIPSRIYAYGPHVLKNKDFNWDNFSQDIYLDKYPVTNRDIIEFNEQVRTHKKLPVDESLEKRNEPSIYLSKEQMKLFCSFKGKQVANALVFDAAAFMPIDEDKNRELPVVRGYFPFTAKNTLKENHCQYFYSEQCREKDIKIEKKAIGWAGHFMLLGGYLEYLENPFEPRRNLKASSIYFPEKSKWQKNGMRSFWNGRGHGISNFSWGTKDPDPIYSEFAVTFRCMKQRVENEKF